MLKHNLKNKKVDQIPEIIQNYQIMGTQMDALKESIERSVSKEELETLAKVFDKYVRWESFKGLETEVQYKANQRDFDSLIPQIEGL